MYPLTFAQVAADLGQDRADQTLISKVIIDSRHATTQCLFFALPGSNTDGHHFVSEVVDEGGFAIVKKGYGSSERIIEVENPLLALQKIAQLHLKRIAIPVVAITGSDGKTTTKDFTAAVLGAKYRVAKTPGNKNNDIGVPLTIMGIEADHEIAVVEMGMSARGEISRLGEIAPPDVAIITNVHPVHLESLGSLENIALAKGEILTALKPDGTSVLNGDDPLIREMSQLAGKQLFYGKGENNDLRAENVRVAPNGNICYDLHWRDQIFPVKLDLPGMHNVYNSLAAVGVGLQFGIEVSTAVAHLKLAQLSGMRLEIETSAGGIKIINDAYNASPQSMEAALDTLAQISTSGNKLAILGDMLELGSLTAKAHHDIGSYAARICDKIIFVGDYAEFMQKGALGEGFSSSKMRIYQSAAELIHDLEDFASNNDIILVKASRGVALERVVSVLKAR